MHISYWRRADPFLLLLTLGLVGYGLVLVHSASYVPNESARGMPSALALRQGLYGAIGLALMVGLARLDYRWLRGLVYPLYAGTIAALGLLLVFGHGIEDYGAQRWIGVGPLAVQPSEPAKLVLILTLAHFFARDDEPPGLRRILASLTLLGIPVGLVYLQPDLGTALSFVAIWMGIVVVAGARVLYLAGLGATGLVALPAVWLSLRDYMRQRVLIFLNPESDPFGAGYNILQAKISIGSGGLWGRGLLNGTQTQLRYLRVAHSDFIFSVLAEELGLVGVLVLFVLLLGIFLRVLRAVDLARDGFGRLVAGGVLSMLAFQAVVNVGANLSLLPVVGIPLPFVSSGGSALITNLAALGIVQSILIHRLRFRY